MGAHARRSPSGASRYLKCPQSPQRSEGIPDTDSISSVLGTACHQVLERALVFGFDWSVPSHRVTLDGHDPTRCHVVDLNAEDLRGVQVAYGVIQRLVQEARLGDGLTALLVETRVSPDPYLQLPADLRGVADGSADVIILGDGLLQVIDFKNGRERVDYRGNVQLILYALGALQIAADHGLNIQRVALHIVQPNCFDGLPVLGTEVFTLGQLLEWVPYLRAGILASFDPLAPAVPGDHCRYCRGAVNCHEVRVQMFAAVGADHTPVATATVRDPQTLTPSQIRTVLDNEVLIRGFLEAVRAYALAQVLQGNPALVPGYKVVQAPAGHRSWAADDVETRAQLAQVPDLDGRPLPASTYEETRLRSPAQVLAAAKKLVTREQLDAVEALVVRPPGRMELAPLSDPREPQVKTVEQMFGAVPSIHFDFME